MTATLADEIAELNAQLRAEIPCDKCGGPASLRSLGHGLCPDIGGAIPPFHKCDRCFAKWYARVEAIHSKLGFLIHNGCKRRFVTIEDFSDYREF